MNEATTRRYTGAFGVIASSFILIQVPLYFLYSGAPPDWNILTRSLIGIIGCTLFVVYFTGLRQLLNQVAPGNQWLGSVLQSAGLLWVAMVFVPQSMEAGAAISVDDDIDTTTEGPFAAAQYLLRRWVGYSAVVLALINLAFVPALYFGGQPTEACSDGRDLQAQGAIQYDLYGVIQQPGPTSLTE